VPRDVTLRSGAATLMPEPACRVSRRSVPQFTSPKSRKVDEVAECRVARDGSHRQRRSPAPAPGRNEDGEEF